MKTRDLPQRPPKLPVDVASFAPENHAGPGQARTRVEMSPIAGGGRPRLDGRPPQASAATASGGHRIKTIAVAVLAVVLVLVAGCGVSGRGNATGQAEGPTGEDAPATTPVPETGDEDEVSEPERDERGFVALAESSGGEAGAANRIEGVRFQIFDGYERLLVDFGSRYGEGAGVPRWSVESSAEGGYIRLHFPGVTSTEIADEDFVGSVLDELYVVRDRGGGLFADVFATHAFRYRVTELPESGRLAVDFRGMREELDLPPTTGDRAVVLQPREAEEVGSPLSVQGYTRLFEGQVTVSLLTREREVISSKTVRANDWTTAWGLFEATLEYSGYEGLATLRVGGNSPRDGSFVGTETRIFLE